MADFLSMKLSGFERAAEKLGERVPRAAEDAVSRSLAAGALLVRNDDVQSILKGAKTGRTYKHGTVVHRASAPGQPPASDTGYLASHIVTGQPKKLLATVEERARYAVPLEHGTAKMAARPHLGPASERHKASIVRMHEEAINAAMRGMGRGR